jgi:hypothetical protein
MSRTMTSTRFVAGAAVILGLSVAAPVTTAASVSAVESHDITFTSQAVSIGKPLTVKIPYVYGSTTCTLTPSGQKVGKPQKFLVHDSSVVARLSTVGLPTGRYRVRVKCGADSAATSGDFFIVGKGVPTKATCEVSEQGFTAGNNIYYDQPGDLTLGVQLTNRSPVLTATQVEMALGLKDQTGNQIKTVAVTAYDIPPGQSVYASFESLRSWSGSLPGIASVSIATRCKTALESETILSAAAAEWVRPADRDSYAKLGGTIINSQSFDVDRDNTGFDCVIRSPQGAIIGGSYGRPEAFVVPAATGTWSAENEVLTPTQIGKVECTMGIKRPAG